MLTKKKTAGSLMLNKDSAPEQIKSYFSKILELTESGREYSINLDDVWPLVYNRKQEAVRALKNNFIQDAHYQVLRKNAQNSKGGRKGEEYWLTTSCLEYFVASKVQPVFEVYRKVFHQAVNSQYQPKSITQEAGIKEGEPYLQKFGKKTIYTMVHDNEPYFNLATIMRYIGYKGGSASRYAKLIKEPMIQIIGDVESPKFYMVNRDGVDALLRLIPKDVEFYLMEALYKDLFDVELPNNEGEFYLYRFTAEEMLDILHALSQRPLNRNDVSDLLAKGRRQTC